MTFTLANAAWAAVGVAAALAWTSIPPLAVLLPLLALPTSALMRLAVIATRDGAPSWRHAFDELPRRGGRKVLVALVQALVSFVALANMVTAFAIGGIIGAASGMVSLYVLVALAVHALVLWTILSDPEQDGPLRWQLRVAAAIAVTRALPLLVLLLIAVLAIIVAVRLIVPALILPSLVLLATAFYVVPQVDAVQRRVR